MKINILRYILVLVPEVPGGGAQQKSSRPITFYTLLSWMLLSDSQLQKDSAVVVILQRVSSWKDIDAFFRQNCHLEMLLLYSLAAHFCRCTC